jgi:hypothetical protein
MRKKNLRFIFTGVLFIALAVGFYFFMLTVAPQSTDPVEMMRLVGTTSGVVIGVSLALLIAGIIGKKE